MGFLQSAAICLLQRLSMPTARVFSPGTRDDDSGTWITAEMAEAYCRLHGMGQAHSVEV